MRPDPDQLIQSLRVSLSDTVAPAVQDRWARYVATAMDLVLQHLQLRLAGEFDAVTADNLDMSATLAELASQFGRRADDAFAPILAALAGDEDGNAAAIRLADATAVNEQLRARVVAVLHALDAAEQTDPQVVEARDAMHRLVRRQVDRINPLVTPLYMSFSPVGA